MDNRYTAALQRQLEELRILHAAASACVEAKNEGELLKHISDLIGEQLFPEEFGVLMLDERLGGLRLHSSYRGVPNNLQDVVIPLGKGITGRVAQTGQPLRIADVSQEADFIILYKTVSPRSELCVPIKLGEQVIGVFNAQSMKYDAYTEADQQLLTTVAGQVAIAIDRLRTGSAERQRSQQLTTIYQASQEIAASLDLNQIYTATHRAVSQIMPADVFFIGLADEATRAVEVVYFWDKEGYPGFSHFPPAQGISAQVITSGLPVLINNLKEASAPVFFIGPPPHVRSAVMVPVQQGGKVIGVLSAQCYEAYTYTEEDQRTLSLLANQTGIAIENARLFGETQRRLQEVTLLSRVISQTASSEDLPSALNHICADVANFFNAPQAAFALLNAEGTQAEVVAEYCAEGRPSALGENIPVKNNLSMEFILEQKKPLAISDAQHDPLLASIKDLMQRRGVVSILIVPILISGEVVGTLGIDLLYPHDFNQNELSLVQNVANQMGQALDRLRLFIAAREHAGRMARLAQISADMNRSFTVDEVLESIGKGVIELNEAQCAVIYAEDTEGSPHCLWSYGLPNSYIEKSILQWQKPFIKKIHRRLEPYLVFDTWHWEAPKDLKSLLASEGIQSAGFWPLLYEGQGLAVISCYYKTPHIWLEPQQEAMRTFTRQAAAALQNAHLFEEARRRALQQEALNAIIASTSSAPNVSSLLHTTLELMLGALNLDSDAIWTENAVCARNLDEEKVNDKLRELMGDDRFYPDQMYIIEDWQCIDSNNLLIKMKESALQSGIYASLIIPLIIEGRHIGGMVLNSNQPRFWRPEEIALAGAVGRQLGTSVERLALLERTREQARQVQQIIDTVPEGVILLDGEGCIQLANPVARSHLEELTGYSEIGSPLTFLGETSLQELLTRKNQWIEIRSQAIIPRIFEVIAQSLDSSIQNGYWVLVVRDITLERENQKRIQMQERLATVGQLAAGIAHDFNNIMAAIVVYTDLLMMETNLSQGGQERLVIIQKQIQRAASLIRQILDFSRRSVMEQSTLDLLPFIKELEKLLGRVLPENIHVQLNFREGEYLLRADPARLQQVFINLALNARDAMPNGGDLRFRIEHVYIESNDFQPLADLSPGEWIRVEITDTGKGIDPADLPHIFEPFFTTKPVGQGTGLGLAQVYGIIKQHGGTIDVQSHPGEGAQFTVYLPALQIHDNAVSTEMRTSLKAPGKGEKILLVEDDPTARQALQVVLNTLNFQPVVAANGEEALQVLNNQPDAIKLIISDLVMPVMGGVELYRHLKNQTPRPKFLFITGHPLEGENQSLLEIGRVHWLQKPFSIQEFSHAIQQLIEDI